MSMLVRRARSLILESVGASMILPDFQWSVESPGGQSLNIQPIDSE